jgi:phosphoribosylformylglycinamidine synthase subunit PurSL
MFRERRLYIRIHTLNRRIEIKNKDFFKDGKASDLIKIIGEDVKLKIDEVIIIKAYNLHGDFNDKEIHLLKEELFCDPVYQEGAAEFYYAKNLNYDFAIEVSYKSGVTDNVGRTSAGGIEDILKRKIEDKRIRSSVLYLFKGSLNYHEMERIAGKVLCNTLIEDYSIFTKEDVTKGKTIIYNFPIDKNVTKPYYDEIDLDVTDRELTEISNARVLSLSLDEMHSIKKYYERKDVQDDRKKTSLPENPTDIEIEVFAQTWSEHCKHKIFAAEIDYKNGNESKTIKSLFKTYVQKSTEIIMKNRKDLLSVFKDNAGIVKFDEEFAYCVKVETHNSPSALDPYGGAMTGIVGVNRDIIGTGMGAYPIFNTDIFCFGSPFTDDTDIPEGLLHPRRIFRGVHKGVKDGGNESGIPTINGSIVFDKSFLGKPLVFCGTGGILPLKSNNRPTNEKYIKKGDLIVMCGGRIGKDGIHGATFSSAHLTEDSPTSAVQIGDPITQKKMLDFIIEARDLGLFSGLTDNGAGGLSSSIGELATFTGGSLLDLEKCPLKYNGLRPWEILLSEAQERMSIAVPPESVDAFLALSKKRDVESTVIGVFTDSGFFECRYNGETICKIEMKMLHDGLPRMHLDAVWKNEKEERLETAEGDCKEALRSLLVSPNIASKEYWVRMYDHEVQGRTVMKPFSGKDNDGPSDGAVIKLFPDKDEGLVVTNGIIPRYSAIDTYHMTANVIDEAVRQAIMIGANPDRLVGLDNFCWPDPVESPTTPDGKYKLAQLVRSLEALYDITIAYNCPCISGKDSMKNDYRKGDRKISVLPTLLFTVTGKIDDIKKATSFYFKKPGTKIYLLGDTRPELGASEYYVMKDIKGGRVPRLDPKNALSLYKKIYGAVQKNLFLSAHDLSDGGLAVALAEAAFSGNLGAKISLDEVGKGLSVTEKLFSESPSRILVTVSKENEKEFSGLFDGNEVHLLGETTAERRLTVKSGNTTVIEDDLPSLKKIWKNALIF